MIFGRKKASAVDRRLDELRREMAKVGTEIKILARYGKTLGDDEALKTDKYRFAGSDSAPLKRAGAFSSVDGQSRASVAEAAGEQKIGKRGPAWTSDAIGGNEGDLPLFENRSPFSADGREKFANYFTAGHFSNLRPLRHEKRVIKNKAIVMIILVVLALTWLLFSLRS